MRLSAIYKPCASGLAIPVIGHTLHLAALVAVATAPGSVFGEMAREFTQSAGMLPFDMHARTVVTIAFGAASAIGSILLSKPDTPPNNVVAGAACAGLISSSITYVTTGDTFGAIANMCGSAINIILR